MPTAIKRHKPAVLFQAPRSLKDKQESNGRTLALNGTAWRTLRALVLSDQPLCEHCADDTGHVVPATEVDHRDNDPTNNSRDNLASLCKPCHSKKTMQELHGSRAPTGCDSNGMPLDPNHPWNVAAMAERSPATDNVEPTCSLCACDRSLADHG